MSHGHSIQNSSGLAGVYNMPDAAHVLYYLLHSLQHRGSDGAGMAVSNGETLSVHKGKGLLSENMTSQVLDAMEGTQAIGQVRMATPGDRQKENLQPVAVRAFQGQFALVCSGMLLNGPSLRTAMKQEGLIFQGTSDAELIAHLIQISRGTLAERIERTVQMLKGSFAFLLMTKNTFYAVRSRDGIRSLYMAFTKEGGILFGSESSAFTMMETESIEEILPGELVILGKNGLERKQIQPPLGHSCAMEFVYYSRPDSSMEGCNVHLSREEAGKALARQETGTADLVIGVPDTALPAAAAFARELGLSYEIGLIKNRYIGSTYVRPTAVQREQGMRSRLNVISSIVSGKSVFLVDDSVQKGQTARRLCQMLREAGAREVHLRIASPLITHSCYAGTEFIPRDQLAAHLWSLEEMKTVFDADSVSFLDLETFQTCLPANACLACFNGDYPYDLHDFAEDQSGR